MVVLYFEKQPGFYYTLWNKTILLITTELFNMFNSGRYDGRGAWEETLDRDIEGGTTQTGWAFSYCYYKQNVIYLLGAFD